MYAVRKLRQPWHLLAVAILSTLVPSVPAFAQLIVLPPHRGRAQVSFKRYGLDGRIENQIARLRLTIELKNTGTAPGEAELLVPLPAEAALHSVVLLAEGQELVGELLSAREARAQYEAIVRRYKDPALVEYLGADVYRARIFPIPPGGTRRLDLSITFGCRADADTIQLRLPVPQKTTRSLYPNEVNVALEIRDHRPIRAVFSSSSSLMTESLDAHRVRVRGTLQRSLTDGATVYYRVGGERVTAWALSSWPEHEQQGFFLLFLTPPVASSDAGQPKDLVLVIDRSGSMSGTKLDQVKEALLFILRSLKADDRFNLVSYADDVSLFRKTLVHATRDELDAAFESVANLSAGGGTNIHDALVTALGLFEPSPRPAYVLFLTDGRPTVGERNEARIAAAARAANKRNARIISFGVGHDVNSRLLDRLARGTRGRPVLVAPHEDLERYLAALYRTIAHPALTDVTVQLRNVQTAKVHPRSIPDLFAGTQVTVVGRYRGEGSDGAVPVQIKGRFRGKQQSYRATIRLVGRGGGIENAFVARFWARRRIGYLLDQIDLEGASETLLDELVALARKYNIVTPFTSFLAEEQLDDNVRPQLMQRLQVLRERAVGATAFSARRAKEALVSPYAGLGTGSRANRDALRVANIALLPAAPEPGTVPNRVYLAGRTLVRRNDAWVELGIAQDELADARKIVLFSDEFFKLMARGNQGLRKLFRVEPPIYVRLDNEIICFVTD